MGTHATDVKAYDFLTGGDYMLSIDSMEVEAYCLSLHGQQKLINNHEARRRDQKLIND